MNLRRSAEWLAFAASCGVILYAGLSAVDYSLGTGSDYCWNARHAPAANQRSLKAEAMARFCAFVGSPNESRLGLHFSDDSGDAVLVYYEPRYNGNDAALRWLDEDHLIVDLGEVTWLTPQIKELGRVKISYSYSGAEPSLE